MGRLDEKALRRTEFAGGEAIRLGDGQLWWFCPPAVEAVTHATPRGPVLNPEWTYGEDAEPDSTSGYHAAMLELSDVEPGQTPEFLDRCAVVAMVVLHRNYDITPEQADSLLFPGAEEPREVAEARWREIIRVVVEEPTRAVQRILDKIPYRDEPSYLAHRAALN